MRTNSDNDGQGQPGQEPRQKGEYPPKGVSRLSGRTEPLNFSINARGGDF